MQAASHAGGSTAAAASPCACSRPGSGSVCGGGAAARLGTAASGGRRRHRRVWRGAYGAPAPGRCVASWARSNQLGCNRACAPQAQASWHCCRGATTPRWPPHLGACHAEPAAPRADRPTPAPRPPIPGEWILRHRPATVVVETACNPAHGAWPGNVFTCGDQSVGYGASFFERVFCQVRHLPPNPPFRRARAGGERLSAVLWECLLHVQP